MICPHCGKDVESFVITQSPNLNLAAGCAPTPVIVNMACAEQSILLANPGTALNLNLAQNLAACAGGQGLNLHYCTF